MINWWTSDSIFRETHIVIIIHDVNAPTKTIADTFGNEKASCDVSKNYNVSPNVQGVLQAQEMLTLRTLQLFKPICKSPNFDAFVDPYYDSYV